MYFLSAVAADAVTEGEFGEQVQTVTDPAAPGYQAFVQPTETFLVIHVDDADQLVGASLLTSISKDTGGGTIVGIPAEFIGAAPGVEGGEPLTESYASGKAERVVQAVTRSIGSRPLGYEVLTPTLWASLVSPVEGFEFSLIDDLTFDAASGQQLRLDQGVVNVGAEELLVLSSATGNQPGIARARNIERLWSGWIAAIQTSDLEQVVGGGSEGIEDFVNRLAAGSVSQQALPTTPLRIDGEPQPLYQGVDEEIATMRRTVIPYVKLDEPGAVRTVHLVNGVGDLSVNESAIDEVIELDGLVQVISNAPSFDVVTNRIDYYDPEDLDFVESLAEALGGAETQFFEVESPENDVVVTLGSDYRPSQ